MKVSLVLETDRIQVVCVPENEWDEAVIRMLTAAEGRTARVRQGSFYKTSGGYTLTYQDPQARAPEAAMIVLDTRVDEPATK